jgi:microsomal dipeptidase-like Zn-dependent dipeptidase/D-alanyl-D-alanine dipeptidase/CubicO group peptidase (beta-lactamase class C family)
MTRVRGIFAIMALGYVGAGTNGVLAATLAPGHEQPGGRSLITIDTHVDIPDAYMREPRFDAGRDSVLKVDLGKMEKGGLDAAFFVIFVEQGALDAAGYAKAVAVAENKYSAIEKLVSTYPKRIRLARTPDDVRRNKADGVLSALIGIENGYSLGHDLARLDAAYARGARYLGVVHVGNNDLCTSSAPDTKRGETANVGLSEFGAQAVARANALGLMVDVSHASDACIADVLRMSRAPVIASHSSARALVPHLRNLTDAELRGIAASGGVAQAVAYKEFVKADPARTAAEESLQKAIAKAAGDKDWDSEKHGFRDDYTRGMAAIDARFPLATLDEYVAHIAHMVSVAGIGHVGIASDFDGGGELDGWRDASQTRNVAVALRRHGFDDAQIRALWGDNLLRTWAAVAAVAAAPAPAVTAAPATASAPAPIIASGAPDERTVGGIVDAVVARYHLPGIAVGLIEDGKITDVVTRGELVAGSGKPVTRRSVFKIASNTKAMTASLLARLVQAGKLKWDDPVVKYLPGFRLHDPWVTQHLLVRDLLVHNSGLPEGGGDLMLWPEPNEFTRADILAGLAHIPPAYGFRAGYAYDNTLYIVAGELAAAVGGASYETLLQREVFGPLALSRCRAGAFDRDALGDVAQPHRLAAGAPVPAALDDAAVPAIASAAAGGVRCSLDDMLAWMGNWLTPDAAQLAWLSPAQRAQMWEPRTIMPISARRRAWNGTHLYAYAYGFRVADMDGAWTVSHTGTLSGMYSAMLMVPDRRSGFVFMINGEADDARTVLSEALLKHLVDPARARPVATLAAELDADASAPAAISRVPDTRARAPATAAALAPWLGVWRDPWLGDVSICAQDDGAVRWVSAKSPRLRGRVMAVGARWLVEWDGEGVDEAWLRFAGDDARRTLAMAKVDPDADFSSDYEHLGFVRTGACDAVSTATTPAAAGLVDVASLTDAVDVDMRYAGRDNFTGARVEGYEAPRCLLKVSAAEALAEVAVALRPRGLRLRVFDCYRPARAVAQFVRWAAAPEDASARATWHPRLAKSALVPDYISDVSGHSRGATVDLTLERCTGGRCAPLDMGTPFDLFDTRANTDSQEVTAAQRANRVLLREALAAAGFENYPKEWWHYTWQPAAVARIRHDVPVR